MKHWGVTRRARIAARNLSAFLLVSLCAGAVLATDKAKPEKKLEKVTPSIVIPLARLGYRGTPTAGLLQTRAAMVTVDFLDSDHILFTYAPRPLMSREEAPKERGARGDRIVHAEVVALPDGKLITEKDWRLHDREPYLWPLSDGSFLLRIGGTLNLLDKDLTLTKVMETGDPIRWVQADKGANLLVVEVEREQHTETQHEKLAHDALLFNAPAPAEDYETYGLRLPPGKDATKQIFHFHMTQPGALTGNDEWLLKPESGSNGKFEITALPLTKAGQKHVVLKVKSDCRPTSVMLRHDVAMVGACKTRGLVEYGITLDGKILWKQEVEEPKWPFYERAANGSRFAMQKVTRLDEDSPTSGEAEVFDVATGQRMFAVPLQPLYSSRSTVALAPDGLRVALLRDGALEIFDLPPVPIAPAVPMSPSKNAKAPAPSTEKPPAATEAPAALPKPADAR